MNIKKIIQEEMDDLDWMRETQPLSIKDVNNKGLEFNPRITTMAYWNMVVASLKSIGVKVNIRMTKHDFNDDDYSVLGLYIENGRTVYTSGGISQGSYQEHISEYANREVEILDGRSLFS